jgi:enoyl-CoA hydratase/carnithine racemase
MDVDVVDGVTVMRMNHPPVNAMDLEFVDTAVAAIRDVDGPIVLTGTGKCFSAGVDLPAIVEGGDEYIGRFMTSATAAFFAVFDHPAPVVAAINGHAIAGGCVLAMASDVRLMSTGLIGLSELVVGVPFPVVGLEICRYAMGRSVARAVLQAQSIDAPAAMTRGWIDEIVSPDDLLPRAIETARAMGQFAPAAFAAMKEQLHHPVHAMIVSSADMDAKVRASWLSEETRAGIAAFMDALK